MQSKKQAASPQPPKFIKSRALEIDRNQSRATIYRRVKRGVLPPPIALGPNSMAFITREIDEIHRAEIAGRSEDDLRAIVLRLVADRQDGAQ